MLQQQAYLNKHINRVYICAQACMIMLVEHDYRYKMIWEES